jgi:hypothetical protein
MGHLSLRELCEGKQEGGSFTGDSEYMLSKAVSTGVPLLGKMEGRFPRAFERRDTFFI